MKRKTSLFSRMGIRVLLAGAGLAGGLAGLSQAETVVIPELINYQGRLETQNAATAYADGLYDLEFRLWDAANGGALLWGEKYSVYVKGGRFNVVLGAGGAPLTGETAQFNSLRTALRIGPDTANRERHLGITVRQDENRERLDNPTESFPRQQLLTAGYAVQAQYAQYAEASSGRFVATRGLQVLGALATFDQGLRVSGKKAELQAGLTVSGGPGSFANGLKVTGGTTELNTGLTVSGKQVQINNGLEVKGGATLSGGGHLNGMFTIRGGQMRLDTGPNHGIGFPENPWGGGGDGAWMTYNRQGDTGENGVLSIGIGNDEGDDLQLGASGDIRLEGKIKMMGKWVSRTRGNATVYRAETDGFLFWFAYHGKTAVYLDNEGTSDNKSTWFFQKWLYHNINGADTVLFTIPVRKGTYYAFDTKDVGGDYKFYWMPLGNAP